VWQQRLQNGFKRRCGDGRTSRAAPRRASLDRRFTRDLRGKMAGDLGEGEVTNGYGLACLIKDDNVALVREQLRLGINPDCPHSQWSHYKDVDGKKMQVEGTALHEAAAWGRLEIAQLLLDAGADPNAYKEGGYRPLHYAAYNEHPDVVKLLLEYGADASLKDDIGNTPLAGRCNNNERIKDILACGAQGGGLEALD
jgi:cytohesin